jgi:hypothetical protein
MFHHCLCFYILLLILLISWQLQPIKYIVVENSLQKTTWLFSRERHLKAVFYFNRIAPKRSRFLCFLHEHACTRMELMTSKQTKMLRYFTIRLNCGNRPLVSSIVTWLLADCNNRNALTLVYSQLCNFLESTASNLNFCQNNSRNDFDIRKFYKAPHLKCNKNSVTCKSASSKLYSSFSLYREYI